LTARWRRQSRCRAFNRQVGAAQQRLAVSSQPFAEALNLSLQAFDQARATALLQRLLPQQSTLERALALSWLQRSIAQASPTIALRRVKAGRKTTAPPARCTGRGRCDAGAERVVGVRHSGASAARGVELPDSNRRSIRWP
jgi:uncharacterized protein YfaS (alpha-2-macroglobulin family)